METSDLFQAIAKFIPESSVGIVKAALQAAYTKGACDVAIRAHKALAEVA